MKADGRFDGHIVQGHVDGVGKLIELERILDSEGRDSENWWLHIEIPSEVEKYTIGHGAHAHQRLARRGVGAGRSP